MILEYIARLLIWLFLYNAVRFLGYFFALINVFDVLYCNPVHFYILIFALMKLCVAVHLKIMNLYQ